MGKILNYPRASFQASYELATAVDSLGGKSDVEVAAKQQGKKVTGSFQATIGSAVKFNLLTTAKGNLATTRLFKDIKLAYTEEEKRALQLDAFLAPPVFRRLAEKFNGMALPAAVLDKMLIKEFEVEEAIAQTVVKHFTEAAKSLGLIDGDGKVRLPQQISSQDSESQEEEIIETKQSQPLEVIEEHSSFNGRRLEQRQLLHEPHTYAPIEVSTEEKRKIQIPLPQKRVAELVIPAELTLKDLEIIKMQIEVLRVYIENS